jgi:glycosyltransferase involved in cell wall biosynthesis
VVVTPAPGGVNRLGRTAPDGPLVCPRAKRYERAVSQAGASEVLFVSKPVGPPWNDSSKNLVRDLAEAMERHTPVVLGRKGEAQALSRGRVEPVYSPSAGGYSPPLVDNLRVLGRLVVGRRVPVWHFFFAPNPRTSSVARFARTLRPARTVQTVCSMPRDGVDLKRVTFADRTIVLSHAAEARFLAGGVERDRIVRIPPCVSVARTQATAGRAQLRDALGWGPGAFTVLYPGDLEFGGGAELTLEAFRAMPAEAELVFACRPKTPEARAAEASLRARVTQLGLDARVRWLGETPRILDVLAAADVVLLPSTSLYAKMDYPLVLLEAMWLGTPVVVAKGTPAAELADLGAALAAEPRGEALAEALLGLFHDGAGRGQRAQAARNIVEREFSPPRMAKAYEAVYDGLFP